MVVIQKLTAGCRGLAIGSLYKHGGIFINAHCLETATTIVSIRHKYYNNKHWDPKNRTLRARKIYKIKLPDFDAEWNREKISPEEIRSKMKEKGMAPPQSWDEKPLYMSCSMSVIDPYVPPEGDGRASILSVDKAKQIADATKRKTTSFREVNKIRQFEGDEFKLDKFAEKSINIYERAHSTLAERDTEKIFEYVTEWCYPFMAEGLKNKTIHWKLLENVEPPKVVNVKSADSVSKGNTFSQITVRLHTKQLIAVYDRHGRLIHGSETAVRQCVEYVVFEKYLANEYGTWRMHSKIMPEWQKTSDPPVKKTFVVSN